VVVCIVSLILLCVCESSLCTTFGALKLLGRSSGLNSGSLSFEDQWLGVLWKVVSIMSTGQIAG